MFSTKKIQNQYKRESAILPQQSREPLQSLEKNNRGNHMKIIVEDSYMDKWRKKSQKKA